MKKTILLYLKQSVLAALLLAGLFSCRPDRSEALMAQARQAMAENRFQAAKSYLDTIQALYPKDLVKLKAVRQLFFEVEFAEQQHSQAGSDSLLALRRTELPAKIKDFVLEKDGDTDAPGYYVHLRQRYSQRSGQTWLQSSVGQRGQLVLTSYYCGGRKLDHSRLRLYAPDGSYAETDAVLPDGALNYSFNDGGLYYEIVRFNARAAAALPDFVRLHSGETIKASLLGDNRRYDYTLRSEDRDVLLQAAEASVILSDIARLEDEHRLADAKMDFLRKKMQTANDLE
ncbi:MAG: hypothetical protein IJR64_08105 [Bacteroidales bacterium]|nr:hypothetical protein [Bacteroidales bacterium]